MTTLVSVLLLLLLCQTHAWGESVRLPAVQDNSIVMVDGEWSLNAGSNSRIRIKGSAHCGDEF